jgi:hypothetical protein
MSLRHHPYDRLHAVGGIYEVTDHNDPVYLGSCAALGLPTHFVTAAHCVLGRDIERLRVNHFGQGDDPFSAVRVCSIDERHDFAVLEAEVAEPKWIAPFIAVAGAVRWGEAVSAIGSPVAILTGHQQESLRIFRGFVQRSFLHTGRLGHTYVAYELSFSSPPGLSGAPLFTDAEPTVLLGVVTENFQSYTIIESEEDTDRGGTVRHIESKQIVTYGVATHAGNSLPLLEAAIPVGNLNAAEMMGADA